MREWSKAIIFVFLFGSYSFFIVRDWGNIQDWKILTMPFLLLIIYEMFFVSEDEQQRGFLKKWTILALVSALMILIGMIL